MAYWWPATHVYEVSTSWSAGWLSGRLTGWAGYGPAMSATLSSGWPSAAGKQPLGAQLLLRAPLSPHLPPRGGPTCRFPAAPAWACSAWPGAPSPRSCRSTCTPSLLLSSFQVLGEILGPGL